MIITNRHVLQAIATPNGGDDVGEALAHEVSQRRAGFLAEPKCGRCRSREAQQRPAERTKLGELEGARRTFEELIAALARVKSYLDYGAFTPVQAAAVAALNGPQDCIAEIRQRKREERARRDLT